MHCPRSNYDLDHELGLDYFITSTSGLGGELRERLDDFVVNEIPVQPPHNSTGEYTHFTLEKSNWETAGAIFAIARAIGVSRERFSYAGNKDKRALTTQRVSAWRIEEDRLREIKINGIQLYDFDRSDFRLNTGNLKGNKFRIVIRRPSLHEQSIATVIRAACEQIKSNGVPNYFGYQRFGTIRPNTHLVGRELVKGNLEESVLEYLGRPFDTEPEDSREARRYLDETRDYQSALKRYPQRLTYERMMLTELTRNPEDYAGALRRLPKTLRTLFVHAYQAFLFNRTLSRMLELEEDCRRESLPLIGYRTKLTGGVASGIQRSLLQEDGVTTDSFRIRPLPELSSTGDERPAFLDVNPTVRVDEQRNGDITVTAEFELPPGSYATTVIRELMKSDPLHY